MPKLPDLSRFELQCLNALWSHGTASIRDVHGTLEDAPSYSTVKKIFERLEEKGAVSRVRKDGKAWLYRSAVTPRAMIRKEIRRLLDSLFGGKAGPLVAHLAEMDELSLGDLEEIEQTLRDDARGQTRSRRRRS
jgi:predicted transcriptional regulator